jgi:hypothetical protein
VPILAILPVVSRNDPILGKTETKGTKSEAREIRDSVDSRIIITAGVSLGLVSHFDIQCTSQNDFPGGPRFAACLAQRRPFAPRSARSPRPRTCSQCFSSKRCKRRWYRDRAGKDCGHDLQIDVSQGWTDQRTSDRSLLEHGL